MDIYSSLVATLLASVIATPALAAVEPIKFNQTAPSSRSIEAKAMLSNQALASVNINTADAETLVAELKGIGLKRAKAILAYRNEHGPFKSIDDLIKIRGISKRIVDQNREKIVV